MNLRKWVDLELRLRRHRRHMQGEAAPVTFLFIFEKLIQFFLYCFFWKCTFFHSKSTISITFKNPISFYFCSDWFWFSHHHPPSLSKTSACQCVRVPLNSFISSISDKLKDRLWEMLWTWMIWPRPCSKGPNGAFLAAEESNTVPSF